MKPTDKAKQNEPHLVSRQEFMRKLTEQVRRMSPQDKAQLREGFLRYLREGKD